MCISQPTGDSPILPDGTFQHAAAAAQRSSLLLLAPSVPHGPALSMLARSCRTASTFCSKPKLPL